MRIAQLICCYPPYRGGMGTVAEYFSRFLAEEGHDVTVVTPNYHSNWLFYGKTDADLQLPNLKVLRLPTLIKYGKAAVLPGFLKLNKNFDAVHLHLPFFGMAELLYLSRIFQKKHNKLIITYHMDFIGEKWWQKIIGWVSGYVIDKLMRQANFITVSSLDYFKSSNFSYLLNQYPEKFIELPFGAEPNFHPGAKPQYLLTKYKLSSKEKILLFNGGLDKGHYFKGLINLLEALAKLPNNYILMVVGSGDLQKYYQQKTAELGLFNRVIFAGSVPQKELLDYYLLSDLLVLPSQTRGEAFGLVLVNAMACGKPVIASNLPGVRTVVEDNVNGYLNEPYDIIGLAKKIELILENPELHRKMGEAGILKVKEKYNWEIIKKRLLNIYE